MAIMMKTNHLQKYQTLQEVFDDPSKVMACYVCVEGFRRPPWLASVYYPLMG